MKLHFLIVLILLSVSNSYAQDIASSNDSVFNDSIIIIKSKCKTYINDSSQISINLYSNTILVETITGREQTIFNLEINKIFYIHFSAPKCLTKIVCVNTQFPKSDYDNEFEFQLTLNEKKETEEIMVGTIKFEEYADGFIFDASDEYTRYFKIKKRKIK